MIARLIDRPIDTPKPAAVRKLSSGAIETKGRRRDEKTPKFAGKPRRASQGPLNTTNRFEGLYIEEPVSDVHETPSSAVLKQAGENKNGAVSTSDE